MKDLCLLDVIGPSAEKAHNAPARLRLYQDLVLKWNPAINIVSRSTESTVWQRHIIDSAQVFRYVPKLVSDWIDLGSGGGFPGLVVAILAADLLPQLHVTLVESDKRKCAFLRQVIRETGISATVLSDRIESLPRGIADVVSARALASLDVLCGHAANLLRTGGMAIFLKGAMAQGEILDARKSWSFTLDLGPSITERDGSVLVLRDLCRA